MMTQENARNIAKYDLVKILPKLNRISAAADLDFYRFFLEEICDELQRTIDHFQANDGVAADGEVYFSIADAHSALSHSLAKKPIDRQCLVACTDTLRDLWDVIHPKPVPA